ncbi:hypothetical protein KBY96_14115 [Cyanobium sp. ATX 6A2]|jgi:hypothetical protein|uniref:hypothetical protein n=1 Tax=Cyanobium sp. ATX 6A2 TaxID=2823700 RepID=UPI0020CC4089|nr:hypothetical protein [Cyanobium sp. ATX 6A2]MCP9889058.1 hypothetical protein [Cyanobium sp. ATX 6A2]
MAVDLSGQALLPAAAVPRIGELVMVTTGSRSLAWPSAQIEAALHSAAGGQRVLALFHGAARGADALVDQAARRIAWSVRPVPAAWSVFGPAAGPIRNRQMLEAAAALALGHGAGLLVLAFPGGNGTASCLREAQRWHRLAKRPVALEVVDLSRRIDWLDQG